LDAASTAPSAPSTMLDNSDSAVVTPSEATDPPGITADTPNTLDEVSIRPASFPRPHENLQNNLRLRMKVWTDPRTFKRYLVPLGFMRDLVNGQPVTNVMYSYALSDNETKIVTLTALEWNSLPFFYF